MEFILRTGEYWEADEILKLYPKLRSFNYRTEDVYSPYDTDRFIRKDLYITIDDFESLKNLYNIVNCDGVYKFGGSNDIIINFKDKEITIYDDYLE